MKRGMIKGYKEGIHVSDTLLVDRKEVLSKKDGAPYLSLLLRDATGAIEARVWNNVDPLLPLFQEGEVVKVEGEVKVYNGRLQLVVSSIEASDVPVEHLRPQGPLSRKELIQGIEGLTAQIEDSHYKALTEHFFTAGPLLEKILQMPGGKRVHHVWVGGLAQHLLGVAQGSLEVASFYPNLDRDLLISGALLHDIGKVSEMTWQGLTVEYTDEGRLLGHVALGLEMVSRALQELGIPEDKGLKILHIIVSHHGEPDMGALKRPKFPEALVIHYMDQMDAKVQGSLSFMEADSQSGNWTAFHRVFQRYLYKG